MLCHGCGGNGAATWSSVFERRLLGKGWEEGFKTYPSFVDDQRKTELPLAKQAASHLTSTCHDAPRNRRIGLVDDWKALVAAGYHVYSADSTRITAC